ncbi:MAG: lantibiotic dehydratase family protein [Bacteroidales bacterium]|nr:lantibiotic dehydratase family protein [Bacteroidales bacterium]
MKNNLPFDIFSTFVVRTPQLPFDFIQNLISDESLQIERLKDIVHQPIINEALFIATPEFHEQLQKWLNGNVSEAKEIERILQTLYKYLSRMSSRSTPFGLFAGCTTGKIGNKTGVILSKSSEHERHTRLDMLYLCNLASALSKHPIIKNKLRYYPNTTIYESGEQLRYIEYRYNKDRRTHHLVQIKNSPYVDLVIQKAKNGESIKCLSNALENEDIPSIHAAAFIEKLIDNQILISELDPTVTGDEFLHRIIKILNPIDAIDTIKETLININDKILIVDKQIGNAQSIYIDIAEDIKTLEVDYDIKYLFQTDVNLIAKESSISEGIQRTLLQGLDVLNKLTSKNSEGNIKKFKDNFFNRYENREIPLLKALDTETGIGYLQNDMNSLGDVSPFIADIVLPSKQNDSSKINWEPIQNFLLNKFLEALAKNNFEIEITDNDLKAFEANWNDLPVTFSSKVSIVDGPSELFPEGKILMESAGNSSASNLLGRFCHGNEMIHQWTKEITEHEQNFFPDTILAEIVHLPESRVGNVILRPVLREYEIPFLTTPAVDQQHTITLDDLLISVKKDEIILRSKRLNKRVIPRLSNAHNYSIRALPVYQFLCDLQNQNLRSGIGFNWGNLSNNYSFRPRVIYKNLIFSPATWVVKKDEIKELIKLSNDQDLLNGVAKWRDGRKLPQKVLLEEGDNVLFVDLCSLLSIKTLLTSVNKKNSFILSEFLFNPNNSVVKSEDGVFTNEFIFGFYRKEKQKDEK